MKGVLSVVFNLDEVDVDDEGKIIVNFYEIKY